MGYVDESDLDLILLLDAATAGPLSRLLADRAGLDIGDAITATRSALRNDGNRETDVEFSWPGGVLFIEDKVDARFTLGQPESYRTEVTKRREAGQAAASVLVCPQRLRDHYVLEAGDSFDAIVTCEELADAAGDDRFGQAAALVLRAAAEPRPTRPATPVDLVRSEWGDAYRRVVGQLLEPGNLLPLGPGSLRTATAEWMYFPSAHIDPEVVWSFGHWLPGGEVRMEMMVEDEPTGLPEGALALAKPAMWWVSARVSPVTFDQPAGEQADAIAEAVRMVLAIRGWVAGAGLRPKQRKIDADG